MSGSPSEIPPFASLTLEGFVEELGRGRAVPGGGAAAAVCASLAAALVAMAARAARDLPRSAEIVEEARRLAQQALRLADDDAASYARVIAAGAEEPASSRSAAIERALRAAAEVPLEISELASMTARWAAELVRDGSEILQGDALVGALVAEAVARSCLVLAEIDLASSPADARLERAASLVADVHGAVEAAAAAARPRRPGPSG